MENITHKVHELKTWAEYFDKVVSGIKKFEVRENDRNFQQGDELKLIEVIASTEGTTLTTKPTGRFACFNVDYVLNGNDFFGIDKRFCIMSISPKFIKPATDNPKGFENSILELTGTLYYNNDVKVTLGENCLMVSSRASEIANGERYKEALAMLLNRAKRLSENQSVRDLDECFAFAESILNPTTP